MIAVKDDKIEVIETQDVKEELRDFLTTYVEQHQQMLETYRWIKDKLSGWQQVEWERTIKALSDTCRALDAGFDPITPPKNWSSGQLIQYLAPVPERVRESIDKAEPIFGRERILIYDPNVEHFQRPRKIDPMAIGFIDLARQRLHFLIGQWDIKADLKFIKGSSLTAPITRAVRSVERVTETIPGIYPIIPTSIWAITTAATSAGSWDSGNTSLSAFQTSWVNSMLPESKI